MASNIRPHWSRRPFQFSIAFVLSVTLAVAGIQKFASERISDTEGFKKPEWHEVVWVDDAVGIAKRLLNGRNWVECTAVLGDGVYCKIESGVSEIGTTGGGYFSIGIQLPSQMKVGDEIELHPISSDPADCCKHHSMNEGEVVLMEYGHPILWPMVPQSEGERIGRLRVVDIGDAAIVVELDINTKVNDWLNESSVREFVIRDEYKLKRSILRLPFYEDYSSSK